MSRIAEMLRTGKPPGLCGSMARPDPTCADVAVPRALKQLEEKHDARRIAKDAGWSIKTLKQSWGI